jgi:hypothetical protein
LKQIDYNGDCDLSSVIAVKITQPIDSNIIHYVDVMGNKHYTQPTSGLFIAIYKNGQFKRVFIK